MPRKVPQSGEAASISFQRSSASVLTAWSLADSGLVTWTPSGWPGLLHPSLGASWSGYGLGGILYAARAEGEMEEQPNRSEHQRKGE